MTQYSTWTNQIVSSATGHVLVVLDENDDIAIPAKPETTVMTNRYDVFSRLGRQGVNAIFTDFDWADLDSKVDEIIYRTSKEKITVEHTLRGAFELLPTGGRLHLLGGKQEGIKTYGRNAAKAFGDGSYQNRKAAGQEWFTLTKRCDVSAFMPRQCYHSLITIADGFVSKPGVFGWKKVDEGSRYLMDVLDRSPSGIAKAKTWLDLGCGFGYLAVMVHQRFAPARVIATDNNAAALIATSENFRQQHIDGEIVASDAGLDLDVVCDYVIANIPFHQGFAVDFGLVSRFLSGMHARLCKGGTAFFVANNGIPIDKLAAECFNVERMDKNKTYSVYRCIRKG